MSTPPKQLPKPQKPWLHQRQINQNRLKSDPRLSTQHTTKQPKRSNPRPGPLASDSARIGHRQPTSRSPRYTKILPRRTQNPLSLRRAQLFQVPNQRLPSRKRSLSPLLWNIPLNNLLCEFNIPNTEIVAYADDVTIVCSGESTAELKLTIMRSLKFLEDWCSSRKLGLSADKTQIFYLFSKLGRLCSVFQAELLAICAQVQGLLRARPDIRLHWVKAHTRALQWS